MTNDPPDELPGRRLRRHPEPVDGRYGPSSGTIER